MLNEISKDIYLRCDDHAECVVFSKFNFEDDDIDYDISIEDAFRGKEQTIGVRTVEGKLKKFKVSVPAGIQNNEKIRLIGQGKRGTGGAKDGDLFIKVKIFIIIIKI